MTPTTQRGFLPCFSYTLAMLLSVASVLPAQTSEKTPATVTMTECEGTNNCATWTFLGTQGNGQWPSGEVANLSVEHTEGSGVTIRRADSTGSSAGLTAVYTGTRNGTQIEGKVTSSWPGHWDIKTLNWSATIGKTGNSFPTEIRICTTPGYQYCSHWTWNVDHYDGVSNVWDNGRMTVSSFTKASVSFHSVVPPSYASDAEGTISSQGNSILNGSWSDSSGSHGGFTATWGTALQDLPAPKSRPIPVPQQRVVVCAPWFFVGVVCQ
jgi:hypothetical protein